MKPLFKEKTMTEKQTRERCEYLYHRILEVEAKNPEQAEAMRMEMNIHKDNLIFILGRMVDIAA